MTPDVDMGKVERAINPPDGELDVSTVADMNKTETLVAVLEVLDIDYDRGTLEARDRVTHGTLRSILSGAFDATDGGGE